MKIGNDVTINNSYNNTSNTSGCKNVREYSNYLMNKYNCLKPGKNASVSVTSGLLRKAMSDEKTGEWLERELSKAPDYIKEAQQSASAKGWRLVSCSIEFGEEYTTMSVCTVTDTPGTDKDIDKWIERVKEKNEEKKKTQKKEENEAIEEKLLEHRTEEQMYTFKGTDMESIMQSFSNEMFNLNAAMNSLGGFDLKV